MKYIDAEKLIANLERQNADKKIIQPLIRIIKSLQQEQPELMQVPCINQETQKKGWLDYGLLIGEIGLHRSNAIDRIKETKEQATEIKKHIAPHVLAILCEYLESVGAEIVLCCLQQHCMDFMFTQDEVKEILQQVQPEVDLEREIDEHSEQMPMSEFTHESEADRYIEWAKGEFRHFYELGLNARKEE